MSQTGVAIAKTDVKTNESVKAGFFRRMLDSAKTTAYLMGGKVNEQLNVDELRRQMQKLNSKHSLVRGHAVAFVYEFVDKRKKLIEGNGELAKEVLDNVFEKLMDGNWKTRFDSKMVILDIVYLRPELAQYVFEKAVEDLKGEKLRYESRTIREGYGDIASGVLEYGNVTARENLERIEPLRDFDKGAYYHIIYTMICKDESLATQEMMERARKDAKQKGGVGQWASVLAGLIELEINRRANGY